jgi:hypothetical protein
MMIQLSLVEDIQKVRSARTARERSMHEQSGYSDISESFEAASPPQHMDRRYRGSRGGQQLQTFGSILTARLHFFPRATLDFVNHESYMWFKRGRQQLGGKDIHPCEMKKDGWREQAILSRSRAQLWDSFQMMHHFCGTRRRRWCFHRWLPLEADNVLKFVHNQDLKRSWNNRFVRDFVCLRFNRAFSNQSR